MTSVRTHTSCAIAAERLDRSAQRLRLASAPTWAICDWTPVPNGLALPWARFAFTRCGRQGERNHVDARSLFLFLCLTTLLYTVVDVHRSGRYPRRHDLPASPRPPRRGRLLNSAHLAMLNAEIANEMQTKGTRRDNARSSVVRRIRLEKTGKATSTGTSLFPLWPKDLPVDIGKCRADEQDWIGCELLSGNTFGVVVSQK